MNAPIIGVHSVVIAEDGDTLSIMFDATNGSTLATHFSISELVKRAIVVQQGDGHSLAIR